MCGIAGFIDRDSRRPADPHLLRRMGDQIAHRGPDGDGYYFAPGVGLAHRRLSIVDVAGGTQPMGNEDGQIQVVFNGEIYNHLELRAFLEARGHTFRTRSDTEVLVHGYEEEGAAFVRRLRGMFAYAIWDSRRRRLVLARDRIGIKPLYFCRLRDRILFASEAKSILVDPDVPREMRIDAFEDYLTFGFIPHSKSIFKSMEQLPPAHTLTVDADRWEAPIERYWSLDFRPTELPEKDWIEAVRAKIDESVRGHLMSDVPLGAFLSGGVDSSIVVSSMSRMTAEPVRTFSIGFEEKEFCELPYAREVAGKFGTRHTEETVTPDAVRLLDEIACHYDEPFGDTSAIPTFLVCELAAKQVKVALSGDGADEAFGGYPRYAHDLREDRIRRTIPRFLRRMCLTPMGELWPQWDWLARPLRLKTAMLNLAADAPQAYANSLATCRDWQRTPMMHADIRYRLRNYDPKMALKVPFSEAPTGDVLSGMCSADLQTLLPDAYLVKIDRASMAHGVEVRPPFLDHELIELACRIPSRFKVHGNEGKWILKKAFERDLPPGNVNRPKRGFNVPINAWMRGPLGELYREEVLNPNRKIADWIDRAAATRCLVNHNNRWRNNGQVLWQLLVLSRWAERYLTPAQNVSADSASVDLGPSKKILLRDDFREITPLRVGFVVHVMQVAGAEVLTEETIKRLGPAIDPTIICLDRIGTIGERLQAEGYRVICLNRQPGRDWGCARRMAEVIRTHRIQVVHAHQYTPFFYAALAKVWCRGGFRLIQTEHGRHYPDIVSPKRRAVNRLVLDRLADANNACCEFSGKALSRVDGFRGNRIEVIENGVDFGKYAPATDRPATRQRLGLDPRRKYVACVARFHPVKDHAMLVRAFGRVAAQVPDADLLLIGDGELRGALEKQVRDLGIESRVKFIGIRRDVADWLSAVDAIALTSVSEAASLTLLEAMASACPVVITDVGGNPELVRRDTDGFLVPRGDDRACGEALIRLLTDSKLAKRMGQSGRERVETTFTLDRTIGRYYDLYRRLAGQ
jgi:asparagine synthase (glutamine-hydrolysing)